jgi:hypothetical protein
MSLPPLPPMPPIEVAGIVKTLSDPIPTINENVRRYGLVMHPYVRLIEKGPFVIVQYGNYGSLFLRSEDSDAIETLSNHRLIEWTDNTKIGNYDPNYLPIRTEGKFFPGLRVSRLVYYGYDDYENMHGTIRNGPFLGENKEGNSKIMYIVNWENGNTLVEEEDKLNENQENKRERLSYARKLTNVANKLPKVKNNIVQTLNTIRVPLTRRNTRKQWYEMAANKTKKPAKTRNIHLPANIARHIAEYAYGTNKNIAALRANAAILGTEYPRKPNKERLGGGTRRRLRKN